MRLFVDTKVFFEELIARGIKHLIHANAVETSISYFRVLALLSRQECGSQSLPQSPQWSDDKIDKKFGIFDDIFLNFSDFHFLFHQANQYGPITFKINIEKLQKHVAKHNNLKISVTKLLPHKWTSQMTEEDKWLTDMSQVFLHKRGTPTQYYVNGTKDVVIHGAGASGLPFDLVDQVVIEENPNQPLFFSQVSSAFQNCLSGHGASLKIVKRNCGNPKCGCKNWENVQSKQNEYKFEFGKWQGEFKSA